VAVLAEFAKKLPQFSLAGERETIDRCFGAGSVKGIVRRLEREETDWAGQALAALRGMSPSALFWSLENLRRGAARTLRQCLEGEIRLTRTLIYHHEFLEGVRAMVLDKDRQPKWDPARIEDVDEAVISVLFEE